MGGPLRILQAGDLRLHRPLLPACDLPAPLRDIFIQARESTASRVFETAIERGDVLLLTGELADFSDEPRLAWFVSEQFRRLQEARIEVVLALACAPSFPAWARLPENVHILVPQKPLVLSPKSGETIRFHWGDSHKDNGSSPTREDEILVRILRHDRSLSASYSRGSASAPVTCESVPVQPDGTESAESGHMRLIECGAKGTLRVKAIPAASVIWATETVEVTPEMQLDQLHGQLRHRLSRHAGNSTARLTLLRCHITGEGPCWESLLEPDRQAELIQELRAGFARARHPVWTWSIELSPASRQFVRWLEQPELARALEDATQVPKVSLNESATSGQQGEMPASLQDRRIPHGFQLRLVREFCRAAEHSGNRGS